MSVIRRVALIRIDPDCACCVRSIIFLDVFNRLNVNAGVECTPRMRHKNKGQFSEGENDVHRQTTETTDFRTGIQGFGGQAADGWGERGCAVS